jgi:hypothetical protein
MENPGNATAPTVAIPSIASAMCTAQSVRRSPNSRVPSSGSTIQTRLFASRALSAASSSDRMASSGRAKQIAGDLRHSPRERGVVVRRARVQSRGAQPDVSSK